MSRARKLKKAARRWTVNITRHDGSVLATTENTKQ